MPKVSDTDRTESHTLCLGRKRSWATAQLSLSTFGLLSGKWLYLSSCSVSGLNCRPARDGDALEFGRLLAAFHHLTATSGACGVSKMFATAG